MLLQMKYNVDNIEYIFRQVRNW